MYLLQDIIGEEKVNRALARLLQQYAFKSAPYPRSIDLVALLREEAGPEYQDLITDLFEKITLYDLKASEGKAVQNAQGAYDITFTVEAKKLYADEEGVETETLLAESIDIGVFTAEPGDGVFAKENVLHFERRAIGSGSQTITIRGLRAPAGKSGAVTLYAGVDPYNKRIDRSSGDNVIKVVVEKPPAS
jgi:aminopeptidase N